MRATRNKVTDEIAWLIERSAGPYWWTAGGGWSVDSTKAVRFSRREDAERVRDHLGLANAIATEHMWCAAKAKVAAARRAECYVCDAIVSVDAMDTQGRCVACAASAKVGI